MIFQKQEYKEKGFFSRMFSDTAAEKAFIQINNLFHEHEAHITAITPEMVENALQNTGFTLHPHSHMDEKKNILNTYIDYGINLSSIDSTVAHHIASLLHLDTAVADSLIAEKASPIYEKALLEALANESIINDEDKEPASLALLQNALSLTEDTALSIKQKVLQEYLSAKVHAILEEGLYSPEQERDLTTFATNNHISLNFDENTAQLLAQCQRNYLLEYGTLHPIDCDIKLQSGEALYATFHTVIHEPRTVTKRVNYHGLSTSIKICKGVRYRIGSINLDRVSEDVLKAIDEGIMYITSKRLIFIGARKNMNIKYEKILNLEPFSNGLTVNKDTGKPLFLEGADHEHILLISRLLNESD